jgi:hypothetical protein
VADHRDPPGTPGTPAPGPHPGSPGPGPGSRPDPRPAPPPVEGDGLSWSFALDADAVFAALGRPAPQWEDIDQDEDLADELAARDRADAPAPASVAGVVADTLPAGPGLAAWLSGQDPSEVSDHDAVAMAAGYRRVASWAQAGELAMVAQIAKRSAARDAKVGLEPDGRPALLTRDAAAQVSLELVMSRVGAEAWAGLALTLAWRLPATAAALAAGQVDLVRARILAEATAPLTDEAAAAVEDAVLPRAGDQTYAQLHAAVRRAVIAADPDGAEQRRQAAERRAKVSLYPDQDCTATLTGTRLPAAHAAAAMARLSALARAMKAAGAGGGLDLLRAHAYIGLLLGTLPLIPPPADGPPDTDPPDEDDGGIPPDQDSPDGDPDTGRPPDADQPDGDPDLGGDRVGGAPFPGCHDQPSGSDDTRSPGRDDCPGDWPSAGGSRAADHGNSSRSAYGGDSLGADPDSRPGAERGDRRRPARAGSAAGRPPAGRADCARPGAAPDHCAGRRPSEARRAPALPRPPPGGN